MNSDRSRFALAALLFTTSGALGLGYELVWIRKAALLVGSSQIALATVLTSFFLGIGLGSLFVGRYLRSGRFSPLFVYGLFEAAIGLFALAFPVLFHWLEMLYGAAYPWAAGMPTALFLLRFVLLFLLFLVPTFFMGGTLPLLLDGLIDRDDSLGFRTSLLYGLNVLGAVAGVLLTGYFGIPVWGLTGTSFVCGAGNLLIAVVALSVFRRAPPLHPPDLGRPAVAPPRTLLALSVVSGFAAIGYQVAWARFFGLFNVADVYRTALLLAVFLTGLASGSLLLAPLLTRRIQPLRALSMAQPLVPIAVYLLLEAWRFADYRFTPGPLPATGEVVPSWYVLGETLDSIFVAPVFQIGLVMLLPAMLMGVGLPALIAAASHRSDELRSCAGTLVFWNTIGAAAGGFAAGYLLLPGLGLTGTLLVLGLLSLAMGLGAEWTLGRAFAVGATRAGPTRVDRAKPGYVLSALAVLLVVFTWDGDLTRRTIERHGLGAEIDGVQLKRIVEGPLTTAYILESETDRYVAAGHVVLANVNRDTASTQSIQGHIPALFYPAPGAPRRCLGIALGSGQSFGALLMYPIEELDVVDISTEMVELSLSYFEPFNHGLGTDERVNVHIDDGRHFVDRAPDEHYDVVSMEPPPPTAEGVFSLYSIEFYRGVDRILRDRGVFMQWLPLYMVTPQDLRGIVKTQIAIFPHTFVIKAGVSDFVVVSFKGDAPPEFRPEWIAQRVKIFERERGIGNNPWSASSTYRAASPIGVVSTLISGPETLARLTGPGPFEDDNQELSYTSGDRQILRRYRDDRDTIARLSFAALPLTPFQDLARYFDGPIPVAVLEEERARTLAGLGAVPPSRFAAAFDGYQAQTEPEAKARAALLVAALFDEQLDKQQALSWIGRAIEALPGRPPAVVDDAARTIARHQIANYASVLTDWLQSLPETARASPLAQAVDEELQEHLRRERDRRAAYLLQ